ncbi:MAG: epoxyqueuosine reductase QueH [Oscillospiraceae bacterium]|nr:epoxyqueuosine reductase QueH [Oscillospiraceae bacterium]MBR3860974.1 epoxyqueuosine reductase QueH [Oscillospiraceae bacterium]
MRMKHNYQLDTDRALAELPAQSRPTLLLHSCCGPCSSYVLEYLTRCFDVTVLFYGPNIQPEAEYEKRLHYQREVLRHIPARLLDCVYDGAAFEAVAQGLENEPEGGARCTACFLLRLEETARRAAAGGFDWFCTTLTVSPHKDAERINRIGQAMGERYGVRWLPSDFKKRGGYLRSIQLAKEYELYRQDWCGCRFSRGAGGGQP